MSTAPVSVTTATDNTKVRDRRGFWAVRQKPWQAQDPRLVLAASRIPKTVRSLSHWCALSELVASSSGQYQRNCAPAGFRFKCICWQLNGSRIQGPSSRQGAPQDQSPMMSYRRQRRQSSMLYGPGKNTRKTRCGNYELQILPCDDLRS